MNILTPYRYRLLISIAALFMLLEGLSFAYVRHYSNDAGFNHHTRVHIMNYYNHAISDSSVINTALMYMHWPLLKIEGVLKHRSVSMLHRYRYIEVHRLDDPATRIRTSHNTHG